MIQALVLFLAYILGAILSGWLAGGRAAAELPFAFPVLPALAIAALLAVLAFERRSALFNFVR